MSQTPSLLKNLTPRRNWLRVTLMGTKSNRSAIGARVTIEAGGRKQMNELVGGGGYLSQNESALYFGLGDAKVIDSLTIRWPNGGLQSLTKVPANQALKVTEK